MADAPYEETCATIKSELLHTGEVGFIARDLGFPDHTEIHNAAKAIIADGIAGALYRMGYRPKTPR